MVCLSMFGHILHLFVHCDVCSDLQGTGGRRLCVTIEPALLLKGDIMVSTHGKEMATRGPLTWVLFRIIKKTTDEILLTEIKKHIMSNFGTYLHFGLGKGFCDFANTES